MPPIMSFYKVMANPRLPMEQRVAAAKFVSAHYGEQGKDIALNWLEARRPPTLPPLQAAFGEAPGNVPGSYALYTEARGCRGKDHRLLEGDCCSRWFHRQR